MRSNRPLVGGVIGAAALIAATAGAQLFTGLEGSAPPTRSTDLQGFPDVVWQNHFTFDVSGAAADDFGTIYICKGAFTTELYESTIDGPPQHLSTISVDISALACRRGVLYGYSNYADPKGIYLIEPATGEATLVLDVYTNTGFRFFALDYNRTDDLLYGYTEYGDSGLYSIDLDNGVMTKVAEPPPASNTQGRAMAIGRNTVFLLATRGDDGVPAFAYDLSQGANGEWVGFTNPYPDYHSTGGATWILRPGLDITLMVEGECPGELTVHASGATPGGPVAIGYAYGTGNFSVPAGPCAGTPINLDPGTTRLAAVEQADRSGFAHLTTQAPPMACGGAVLVQAVDVRTCTSSNVLRTP